MPGKVAMERVSVIIPTYRDTKRLIKCIDALKKQTYPSDLYEILVVDNSPDFELRDQAHLLKPARVLNETQRGSYAARNLGIAHATGNYIAFTDSDCLPSPTWIEAGVAALKPHKGRALIVGRIEVFPRNPQQPTAVELFEIARAFPQQAYAENDHFGATANVFTSRTILDAVGSFQSALFSGGDREFGVRVYDAGFPVEYSRDAAVQHPARRTLSELLMQTRRVTRGAYELEQSGVGGLSNGHFWRALLKDLRPPVQSCYNFMRDDRLGGWAHGLRAAGVMVFWRYYRAGYRLNLLWSKN